MREGGSEADSLEIVSSVSISMAFACENVSTDPAQRMTFHSIVDVLGAAAFPTQTPMLWAIFGFQRPAPGFLVQCKVDVVPPVGDPIASQQIPDVAFRPDQPVQRQVVGFQGIVWPAPGEYTCRFSSRAKVIASFPIRLVQAQLPGVPTR